MKVEKINIKKELLDIPEKRPYVRFFKRDKLSVLVDEENPIFNPDRTQEETWFVEKIRDMHGQNKFYLVKVDERDLFIELISITNSVLKTKIRKAVDEFKKYDLPWILEDEKENIRNLSWWKRLFKRF